ncbi:Aminodeoxychorismate lyase [Marinobacter nitratireducens]|uniref:Aminodeoxychorismate lyase n=1 Tax=Marinobacter nitratireducens TaxID=1137280 RepID=A0A072N463_9GAMM|nr:aminotransferase class IV [Marinobacter nitratireducens]KEF32037.1 Aminodeoxychorismate lyase [Marinobacter nitratireducens]
MINRIWADEASLPANDRGAAYGDGLFETIRMAGRKGVLLSRHIERMVSDAHRLGISVSRHELDAAVAQAIERWSSDAGDQGWVLKLTLTRGAGGRGYRPSAGMAPNLLISSAGLPPEPPAGGVDADFSRVPLTVNPLLSGIKSLNRLEQVMAARELHEPLFELIMSNPEGHLVEGTRTNLLIKSRDGWLTPPVRDLAVAGIMRQWTLERLRELGNVVQERSVEVGDVLSEACEGLFLLNSVLGVVPVCNLAGHDLPVDPGLATICHPLELLE